ncbi:MAG: tRNA glutamyl-Q(34) synthetase GluQRS [Rhizobiales bacterium]|nr:tRNA glutamyl-Q(34) synthetase GluQRS [Hyphomicrobiales bacterium]
MSQKPVFRFAPSPNGALHLGHAYSALLNHALAQRTGGRFLLRMEDIDLTRCSPALEAAMLEDLEWLGLTWETPILRQSERFAAYESALAALHARDLLYPAFLSRNEIKAAIGDRHTWPHDPDGAAHYPGQEKSWGTLRRNAEMQGGRPFAWRLDMAKALTLCDIKHAARWGDVLIARKEVPTSYHLAVVIDDAAQGITHVVRGRDLERATSVHLLLQALLDLPSPIYHHHPLILDEAGEKLSKSTKATGLSALRAKGAGPADICALIGWDDRTADIILDQLK